VFGETAKEKGGDLGDCAMGVEEDLGCFGGHGNLLVVRMVD
jgi:hypothetical protein